MMKFVSVKSAIFWLLIYGAGLQSGLLRAEGSVLTPPGSNTGITVENAVTIDGETLVFFATWPELGDPNSGKDCGLDYYRASVVPGTSATVVARNVCSGLIQKSRMLEDGSAVIVASRQLERWKDGKKTGEYPFKALPSISRQGIVNDLGGPDMLGISAQGHVTAINLKNPGELGVVSLTPQGEIAWQQVVPIEGAALVSLSVEAEGGGALLTVTSAGVTSENTRLHIFDRSGAFKSLDLTVNGAGLSPEDMDNMSPEEMQAVFMQMARSNPRVVKQISTHARPGGGYDVLYRLNGGATDEQGLYLLQLSATGEKEREQFFGAVLEAFEIREWADFHVDEEVLRFSGRVQAFQENVQAKRDKYMQNIVIEIDLKTGRKEARLIPLDRQYLEAAMNAGDAELRHLPGLPGGKPVLLTSQDGRPVDVAVGTVAHRSVLRINEVGDDSPLWTLALDEQRKTQVDVRNQPSEAEQMAAMQQLMQGMADGSFFEAQIAELEKMLNDPNLSEEQRKQFKKSIEQLRMSMPERN